MIEQADQEMLTCPKMTTLLKMPILRIQSHTGYFEKKKVKIY